MKQYKVYKHPSGSTEAVKQGWSWPGFFFGFIWAMVKKMWGLGVGVPIGFFVLGFIIGAAGGGSGGDALINCRIPDDHKDAYETGLAENRTSPS